CVRGPVYYSNYGEAMDYW
nr:immunoglobulin heavy chain junction region [Mus musculus]NSM04492.1 immunoglobulin heavy chain junction region [Mus musculus]NSM04827.1 immunoglobulin heavy chain junction region [Mus musculus]NSM05967.1 immunoglobulin heavy chain junction region [Mus musculus]